jgi:hypothetical protein
MDFAKERLYFRGHLLSNSNPNEQTSPERLKVVGGYSNVTTYQLWPDFRVLKIEMTTSNEKFAGWIEHNNGVSIQPNFFDWHFGFGRVENSDGVKFFRKS